MLGDGEEIVLAISDVVREWKEQGSPGGRDEVLYRLAASGGVYVPKFYDVDYLPTGGSSGSRRTGPACRGGSTSTR